MGWVSRFMSNDNVNRTNMEMVAISVSRMTKSELALQRLLKANKFLQLALDTRAIAYETTPYVIAASILIQMAITKQHDT